MTEGATILRDGLRLHLDSGGSGAPVVFQHGLGGDRRQTADVFPDDAGTRLTLECRGHGLSEAGDPSQFSIATFADDLAATIEALGVGPVVMGGISMGAAIAVRLAIRRPDLVRALMVVRPAWVTAAAPDSMQPNAEVGELLARLPPAEAHATFLGSATGRRLSVESPDNLASLAGFFGRSDPVLTAALLKRISADGPGVTNDEVRGVVVPTLVVGCGRDAVHPWAYACSVAALIREAQLVEVTPKSDDRARYRQGVREAIGGFLRRTASAPAGAADPVGRTPTDSLLNCRN